MTVPAVRLGAVTDASMHVLPTSHWLQMVWAYAVAYST